MSVVSFEMFPKRDGLSCGYRLLNGGTRFCIVE